MFFKLSLVSKFVFQVLQEEVFDCWSICWDVFCSPLRHEVCRVWGDNDDDDDDGGGDDDDDDDDGGGDDDDDDDGGGDDDDDDDEDNGDDGVDDDNDDDDDDDNYYQYIIFPILLWHFHWKMKICDLIMPVIITSYNYDYSNH